MAKNFEEIWTKVEAQLKVAKGDIPKELGNHAQRFFTRSFNNQGFTYQGFEKWEEVQRRKPGTKAFKYPKRGAAARHSRAILVDSGNLRRAVAASLKSAAFDRIVLSVDVPYAEVHNEGSGRMPQRKFMGDSHILNTELTDKIRKRFANVFK